MPFKRSPNRSEANIHPLLPLKVSHLRFRLCGSPFSDEPGSRENGRHSRPALQDNLLQRMAWIWIEGVVAQVCGRRESSESHGNTLDLVSVRSRLQAMWGDSRASAGRRTGERDWNTNGSFIPAQEVMSTSTTQGSALDRSPVGCRSRLSDMMR